ncbi:MAG: EVE domain-containing protein [Bdellovibrionales bacterium]|nr:EVE domain-containing protein [Bdellovibrionales bacterium]
MKSIQYWLMKSEPLTYSIEHLKKDKKALWDGVRNYQARNFMKNMNPGDKILFYHSNTKPPGIAGLACVSQSAVPDPTAFDKNSPYFDPKSTKEKPRWFCVEVQFEKAFSNLFSLEDLRKEKSLKNMLVLKKGQRLSVQPVTKKEYDYIIKRAED